MNSPANNTITSEVDPATGVTVTTERDGDGTVIGTTTTTLDGTQTVEMAPDENGDVRVVEDGREIDPAGVADTYHVERIKKPDGSSAFSRTETSDNGSDTTVEGSVDAEGNESYTMRTTEADGTTTLTTRTTGPDGHGSEHVTVTGSDGSVQSDTTIDI